MFLLTVGIQEKLWEIGDDIKHCQLMEMQYQRQSDDVLLRVVQLVAILFSEYYFYLIAYLTKPDENGANIRKFDYR